jgi:hypothetical protein
MVSRKGERTGVHSMTSKTRRQALTTMGTLGLLDLTRDYRAA